MPRNITVDLVSDIFIESLLIALILFSPLIYGGVTNLALTIIELVILAAFFGFFFKLGLEGRFSLVSVPARAILLFSVLIIFQLLALPKGLLSFLSPHTAYLYSNFRVNPTGPFSLSIYPEAGLNLCLQFLSYLAVFWIVLNYIDTESKVRRFTVVIIIAGFLYSLYGIIHRLTTPPREFATFINANHFAAYIEMIIPLTIAYALISFSQGARLIFLFLALVEILALFLSLSRAGIVCFTFTFFIFLLILEARNLVKKRMGLMVILFFGLLLLLSAIGMRAAVINELKTLFAGDVISGRLKIFKDTLRIVKDFPFFGTGLGTFGEIFQKYKTFAFKHETYGPVVSFSFAHSEPLQIFSETGLSGFLLLSLFLFKYLKNVSFLWLRRREPYAAMMTLGCLAGLFSIGLHSTLDFVFHIPANAVLFFILLALVYRVVHIRGSQSLPPIPRREFALSKFSKLFLAAFFCLCFIFTGSLIIRRYRAEAAFGKIKDKQISETGIDAVLEYKKTIKEVDRAIAFNPNNSLYFNKKAELLSELALREDLADQLRQIGDLKGEEEILRAAQEYYTRAVALNPTKPEYHLRLGWLYSVMGKEALVEKELRKALTLDPQDERIQAYVQKFLEINKETR
ncbi:MAG: O-antigen ligase family protein [Candidatus Omnitrophota bacterium]|jgi:O-antigen ligase